MLQKTENIVSNLVKRFNKYVENLTLFYDK